MVYKEGDKVRAVFQSACPRNNVRLEGTFLTVEGQDPEDSDKWELVRKSTNHCLHVVRKEVACKMCSNSALHKPALSKPSCPSCLPWHYSVYPILVQLRQQGRSLLCVASLWRTCAIFTIT